MSACELFLKPSFTHLFVLADWSQFTSLETPWIISKGKDRKWDDVHVMCTLCVCTCACARAGGAPFRDRMPVIIFPPFETTWRDGSPRPLGHVMDGSDTRCDTSKQIMSANTRTHTSVSIRARIYISDMCFVDSRRQTRTISNHVCSWTLTRVHAGPWGFCVNDAWRDRHVSRLIDRKVCFIIYRLPLTCHHSRAVTFFPPSGPKWKRVERK